jgi:hypothetical protein
MRTLPPYDTNRYSEELYGYTEAEYAEVMREMAEGAAAIEAKHSDEDFDGYEEFSDALEASAASENFTARDGKLHSKPQPKSRGRIGGFEL